MEAGAATRAPRGAAWAALALLLLALGALGTWARSQHYWQPDEAIALAVSGRVLDEGTLDTNWGRTAVEPVFRYDQYNFSAYYLAAAGWLALRGDADPAQRLATMREFSGVLHALAVLLAALLGWRWGRGAGALFGAALSAVAPTLLQDALYARPEAFVSVLTLVLLLLLGARRPRLAHALGAGALCGLLLATKVSFAPLAPLALLVLLLPGTWPAATRASLALRLLAFGLALLAGFALGAPYALAHPHEYVHGIRALLQQYAGGHLPHGLPEAGLWQRFAYGAGYLQHAVGWPVVVLGLCGLAALARERRWRALLPAAALLALLCYFLQTRAFFERNFSHVLPVLFVLAGVGAGALAAHLARPGARALLVGAAFAVALLAPLALSQRLLWQALPQPHALRVEGLENALRARGQLLAGIEYLPELQQAAFCGPWLARELDYGHPALRARSAATLAQHGYTQRLHLRGPFSGLPSSTLQTYHGGDLRYHAPPQPWPQACLLALVPLPAPAAPLSVDPPTLQGAARRDGQHPDAMPAGWSAPLYGTWAGDDAHTGAIGLATIRACRDFVLPLASGPSRDGVRLRIERRAPQPRVLHDGAVPAVRASWFGLQVRHADAACAEYAVLLEDRGRHWGAWAGLGHPVHAVVPPIPSTLPSASAP